LLTMTFEGMISFPNDVEIRRYRICGIADQ
jgi:hypothetical protein